SYVEWWLGPPRMGESLHVVTESDILKNAIFARNPHSADFPDRCAFHASSEPPLSVTADRTEFIGRNGTLRDPAALRRTGLSGRVGGGLDPAAVLHVRVDLKPGEEKTVLFLLGQGRTREHAEELIAVFGTTEAALRALEEIEAAWTTRLGTLVVRTP